MRRGATRRDATAQRFLGSGRVPRIFEASREGTENAARTMPGGF